MVGRGFCLSGERERGREKERGEKLALTFSSSFFFFPRAIISLALSLNPQDQVTFPGNYHVPTRTLFKDNHRPCVPTPNINNMNPEMKEDKCIKTMSTCVAPTKPLYQYDVCG